MINPKTYGRVYVKNYCYGDTGDPPLPLTPLFSFRGYFPSFPLSEQCFFFLSLQFEPAWSGGGEAPIPCDAGDRAASRSWRDPCPWLLFLSAPVFSTGPKKGDAEGGGHGSAKWQDETATVSSRSWSSLTFCFPF